jgi:Domain of unknown function (DUF4157)
MLRASTAPTRSAAPAILHDVLRSPGVPLDRATREAMEPRFGHSFADVRVHADERAAASSDAVGALAYTAGSHVVFGAGRYAPGSGEGRRLLAHELAHVVQQSGSGPALRASLAVGPVDAPEERAADAAAEAALNGSTATIGATADAFVRRAAIYSGKILDEGSCEHLACNSKWACEDANGVECPEGTRNAFKKKNKKYSPLFSCDLTCDKAKGCSDSANWMAIPHARFKFSKCDQDLVICANGRFTHVTVRDRSERKAWEVSHGVQDSLAVSPYASFTGSIYADESDAVFKTDTHCHKVKKADAGPDQSPDAGLRAGDAGFASDAGMMEAPQETD